MTGSRPGQLLAVLEIPELEDELRQDEASIKRATEEIHRADADLARAESTHEMAHLASTRLASASQARPNLIAQQDLDDAVGRDKVAEAQVSTARASIASAHEQLAVTQANRSKTATLFGYARITAPFDGVITHRFADTGAMIQAGTSSQTQTMPLVRLSQNSLLRLIIPVPESAASRIHDKGAASTSASMRSAGRFQERSPASERLDTETRTMRVEVDVPNPKLELLPGMFAQVSIALERGEGRASTVPIQTIDRVGDARACWSSRTSARSRRAIVRSASSRPIASGRDGRPARG